MFRMTKEELARAIASEMGSDIAIETEKQLNGEGTRAIGITEAAAIGAFIAQIAQLAIQIYQARRDRASLVTALEAQAPKPAKLSDEKRRSIIALIAGRLTGSN
jgi:hypothetical protein